MLFTLLKNKKEIKIKGLHTNCPICNDMLAIVLVACTGGAYESVNCLKCNVYGVNDEKISQLLIKRKNVIITNKKRKM